MKSNEFVDVLPAQSSSSRLVYKVYQSFYHWTDMIFLQFEYLAVLSWMFFKPLDYCVFWIPCIFCDSRFPSRMEEIRWQTFERGRPARSARSQLQLTVSGRSGKNAHKTFRSLPVQTFTAHLQTSFCVNFSHQLVCEMLTFSLRLITSVSFFSLVRATQLGPWCESGI